MLLALKGSGGVGEGQQVAVPGASLGSIIGIHAPLKHRKVVSIVVAIVESVLGQLNSQGAIWTSKSFSGSETKSGRDLIAVRVRAVRVSLGNDKRF